MIMLMLLVFSVAISVFVLNTNAADATETTDSCEVKIVDYTAEEATEYLTDDTYPTLDGYLFAGWYTSDSIPKEDTEASAYAIRSSVPSGVTSVYALFMPSHILDVKAQLSGDMVDKNSENDGSTSIRFITTVNSLLYKQVGFEITYTSSSGVKKTVVNTKFVFNQAGTGGAIYNNGAQMTVTNSKFAKNTATTSGGAINTGSSNGKLILIGNDPTKAMFDSNKSQGTGTSNGGGAINVSNGTLEVTGYIFEYNQASVLGGAIRASGTKRIIKNSIFTGNYTTGDAGHGGAIYLNNEYTATLTGNTFTNNHTDGAKANGGAVCLSSTSTNINYDFGWANTYANNAINGDSSQGKDIYIPTTTTELEETETGTGKETDENIGFGQ